MEASLLRPRLATSLLLSHQRLAAAETGRKSPFSIQISNGKILKFFDFKDFERTNHYLDLDGYDICEEVATGKEGRTNVLVLSSTQIENSFFDTVSFIQFQFFVQFFKINFFFSLKISKF